MSAALPFVLDCRKDRAVLGRAIAFCLGALAMLFSVAAAERLVTRERQATGGMTVVGERLAVPFTCGPEGCPPLLRPWCE